MKQRKIRSGRCDLCNELKDDLECSDGYWLCVVCEHEYIAGNINPTGGEPSTRSNRERGVTQVDIDFEDYFSGEYDDLFEDVVYFDLEEEEFYVDFDDDFEEILSLYYNNLIG